MTAKSKPKRAAPVTVSTLQAHIEDLQTRFPGQMGLDIGVLAAFNVQQLNRIKALEEAICPRVVARLQALERGSVWSAETHTRTDRRVEELERASKGPIPDPRHTSAESATAAHARLSADLMQDLTRRTRRTHGTYAVPGHCVVRNPRTGELQRFSQLTLTIAKQLRAINTASPWSEAAEDVTYKYLALARDIVHLVQHSAIR